MAGKMASRVGVIGSALFMLLFVSACASSSRTGDMGANGGAAPEPPAQTQAPAAQQGNQATVTTQDATLEPFVEEVPGTLIKFKMIPIPAGSITIETADGPQQVEIKPIWMSETEVQWDGFDTYAYGLDLKASGAEAGSDGIIRPSKPYGAPDRGFGHEGYAALSMTYGVGMEYSRWLTEKTGNYYRLPTIAEWEYACRAGGEGQEGSLGEYAWVASNSQNKTQPVASKKPNAWGLHDMLGNAIEWCTGLNEEEYACGGSYLTDDAKVSCSYREQQEPFWNETDPQIPKSVFWLTDATFIGFRVVRDPGPNPNE